jgi:ectoine hydroxylase-related dioxygenase (phytanoyl-CoA dioxygenase family)
VLLKEAMTTPYSDCTSKTLHRLQIEPLQASHKFVETPSLAETKVAKVLLPAPPPAMKVSSSDFTLTKEEATPEAIIENLKKYGVCKVNNLFDNTEIDSINAELDPFFAEKQNDPRLFPKETIRVTNTVSKSPLVVNKIMSHPLNLAVAHKTLDQANAFWIGDNLNIGYCPAVVSSSIAFQVAPNSAYQALHRDDQSDHNVRVSQTYQSFDFSSESQIGFSVALTRTTKQNGATRVIPGSHMWDHLQKPDQKDCIYNEMDKGDATFMLASVVHSASSNTTENEVRRILILFMGRGIYRAKENIFINADLTYFRQFSEKQLARLGFAMSEPFGNMYELQDPMACLKPDYQRTSNYSDICKVVHQN